MMTWPFSLYGLWGHYDFIMYNLSTFVFYYDPQRAVCYLEFLHLWRQSPAVVSGLGAEEENRQQRTKLQTRG